MFLSSNSRDFSNRNVTLHPYQKHELTAQKIIELNTHLQQNCHYSKNTISSATVDTCTQFCCNNFIIANKSKEKVSVTSYGGPGVINICEHYKSGGASKPVADL